MVQQVLKQEGNLVISFLVQLYLYYAKPLYYFHLVSKASTSSNLSFWNEGVTKLISSFD